jgi:hypothetical protein
MLTLLMTLLAAAFEKECTQALASMCSCIAANTHLLLHGYKPK